MIIKPTTPKIYTPQDKYALDLDGRDVRGSKIYDRSGEGNHGAITGAVIKPINYGLPVLSFDGTDDIINCGHDTSLNITDEITIEFVVRKTNNCYVFSRASIPYNSQFSCYYTNRLKFYGSSLPESEIISDPSKFLYGVFTKDSANVCQWYVNGRKSGNSAIQAIPFKPNADLIIGARADLMAFLNGEIPFFRIFSRLFSPSEISQKFNDIKNIYGIN